MRHSHKLEKRKYDSVRDYVQAYREKVKTLSELKDLIYSKFGLQYTLNQITFLGGKWNGEAVVVEKESNAENECSNLVKALKKMCLTEDDIIETEYTGGEKNILDFMFYSNQKMKECYLKHSDVIFINKRFT